MTCVRPLLLAPLLAVAACTVSAPPPQQLPPQQPVLMGPFEPPQANFPQRMLAAHNRERAAAGVPPLTWNASLAASAAAYGPALAALPSLAHSPDEQRRGQGENLWMGTRDAFTLEAMVGSWAGEKRWFRPGTFPDVSTDGDWHTVGHYTQMIWRTTTELGCALHQTQRWDYLICRYAPAGNVIGAPVP